MSSNPPKTPEEILFQLVLANTQILNRMSAILEQQVIYTNTLLFPNNDASRTSTPANSPIQPPINGQQEISTKPSGTEPASSKSISKKDQAV